MDNDQRLQIWSKKATISIACISCYWHKYEIRLFCLHCLDTEVEPVPFTEIL